MEKDSLTSLPLVSVCIPAHNSAQFIDETLKSVFSQSYPNIEVIVVDDGSTDGTKERLDNQTDERLKAYTQPNAGAAAARNFAYNKATGQFIKFMDADDIINETMIASQVKLAMTNPGSVITAGWGRFYNNDITTFKLSLDDCRQTLKPFDWLYASWHEGKSMTQAGMFLIPRNIIENAGNWDESLSLTDDLDFYTRIILKSKTVVFDPEAILYYRSGLWGSLSGTKDRNSVMSAFMSMDKATHNFLSADSSSKTRLACANVWQSFIYNYYPYQPDLIAQAQKRVNDLGGSSLKFQSGGITRLLSSVLGWKAVQQLKTFIKA